MNKGARVRVIRNTFYGDTASVGDTGTIVLKHESSNMVIFDHWDDKQKAELYKGISICDKSLEIIEDGPEGQKEDTLKSLLYLMDAEVEEQTNEEG